MIPWLAALGCRDGDAVLVATSTLSDTIATVAFVRWTPPAEGTSWVEYGLDPSLLDETTPAVASSDAEHEQVLLGLKPDRTWWWRAVTEVRGVRLESPIGELTTGTPPPQASVATLNTAVDDPSRQDGARWLLTVTPGPGAATQIVIYDRDGDPVWYHQTPSAAHTVRPGWDGRSIVYGRFGDIQAEHGGGIYRISMDGRSELRTPTLDAHHDFVERRDGTFAYLSHAYREDVDVEGRIADVVSNVVLETPEGVGPAIAAPVPVYDQFDDSGHALYWTCKHMAEDFDEPPHKQWTHGNSLIPDPVAPDEFYWLNLRYQDALLQVSRTTHRIVWEIGGRHDDSDLTPEDRFDHGHLSHVWPGGFLMFDNNSHGVDGPSRVREYAYDQPTKHVSLVRQWDGGSYTRGMADARRTDAGTVVMNFPADRVIQERTDDDELVWELQFDELNSGRIVLLHSLYDLDDPYPF